MLPTTLDLDEEVLSILQRLVNIEKRSQTEILREALQCYLQQAHASNPRLPSGIGRYHSGRNDISRRAEELIQQAVRKDRNDADR